MCCGEVLHSPGSEFTATLRVEGCHECPQQGQWLSDGPSECWDCEEEEEGK